MDDDIEIGSVEVVLVGEGNVGRTKIISYLSRIEEITTNSSMYATITKV